MILLDTNVVSEWASPQPSQAVQGWLNTLDEAEVFISAMTLAEIKRGILLLPSGRRRTRLAGWLEGDLLERFRGKCLPVEVSVSLRWGELMVNAKRRGVALDAIDALIAATASTHGLLLATRNIRHFSTCDIPLLNPWDA